jgi:hypothetical protein
MMIRHRVRNLLRERIALYSDMRPTALLKTGVRVKGVPQTLSNLYRQLRYTAYAMG